MVAFVIRAGTLIAGDTELGVRLVSMLLAVPATWAVWRSAALLFQEGQIATTAALFFNLTLILAVGTVITTPDSPLLVASAFVLFFLAKVMDSKRGIWWLAVGAAVGTSLLSKYTALFFGASIFRLSRSRLPLPCMKSTGRGVGKTWCIGRTSWLSQLDSPQ